MRTSPHQVFPGHLPVVAHLHGVTGLGEAGGSELRQPEREVDLSFVLAQEPDVVDRHIQNPCPWVALSCLFDSRPKVVALLDRLAHVLVVGLPAAEHGLERLLHRHLGCIAVSDVTDNRADQQQFLVRRGRGDRLVGLGDAAVADVRAAGPNQCFTASS
jgi:hypothetical protein